MNPHKVKSWHVLLFCILAYIVVILNSYANQSLPGGVDAANHLFQTWFIKEYGMANWNPYWYTGSPLLDQYPPLTHIFSAVLATFLGVAWGYKLAFALGFLFLPVSFWYFLSEFELSEFERKFSLLFFSFSVVFVHYFQGGVFSALLSFNIVIFYFKFLKKVIDYGKCRDILIASVLLALCALSHALNPVYAVIFSFLFLLIFSYKKIKEFILILTLTFFLSAWFWIPYLINYPAPKASSQGFDPLLIFMALGRAFVVSANYLGILFLLVLFLALILILFKNIKNRIDLRYTYFIILLFLTLFIMRLFPIIALQETKRTLFFVVMFLSVFIARGISNLNLTCNWAYDSMHKEIASLLLISPLVILFFAYPQVNVDIEGNDVHDLMAWIKNSPAERVLVLPERFDIMVENKSYFPVAEDTYCSFLIPYKTNKRVLNGLWSVGVKSIDIDPDYGLVRNLKCKGKKTYFELLNDASWINKNTLGIRKTCAPRLNNQRYCELVREASLDLIVVNKLFPGAVGYIDKLDCTKKSEEFPNFIIFEIIEKKPFVYFSDQSINYDYSQMSGDIQVDFSANKNQEIEVNISESYVGHWKAFIDEREIKVMRNDYGFINLKSNVSAGFHHMHLKYSPEKFNGLFLYLSLLTWILVVIGIILSIKTKNGR